MAISSKLNKLLANTITKSIKGVKAALIYSCKGNTVYQPTSKFFDFLNNFQNKISILQDHQIYHNSFVHKKNRLRFAH